MSAVSVGQADTVAEGDCVTGDPPIELLATLDGTNIVTAVEIIGVGDGGIAMLGLSGDVGNMVGTSGEEAIGLDPAMLELAMLEAGVDMKVGWPATDELGVGTAFEGEPGTGVVDWPAGVDEDDGPATEGLGTPSLLAALDIDGTALDIGEDIPFMLDIDDDGGITSVREVELIPGTDEDASEDVIPGVDVVITGGRMGSQIPN